MLDSLKSVVPLLRRMQGGEDLTSEEAFDALDTILEYDETGYYYLALNFGIMIKGPTADELYGFCQTYDKRSVKLQPDVPYELITDLSGTGGDRLKTFNVGTTASFIVAAAGLYVAKQTFRSFTGVSGSSDIFEAFGVHVPFADGDPQEVERTLEQVGIAAYYYPSFGTGLATWPRVEKKFIDAGLTFLEPPHLIAFAYAPVKMKSRVYGVFSEQYLEVLARLLRKLGFERGMTVHGLDGIDEVSNIGETRICEFEGDRIHSYTIAPHDLGLKKATYDDIKGASREQSIIDFVSILFGLERGPKLDIVLANAAATLCVTGKAKSLKEGVAVARSIIDDGLASDKLEALVHLKGAPEELGRWKKKAGITS